MRDFYFRAQWIRCLMVLLPVAWSCAQAFGIDAPTALPECLDHRDCDDGQPCTVDACVADECSSTPAPDGASDEQIAGDCSSIQCNNGEDGVVPDPSDLPDDDNQCTRDFCTGTTPEQTAQPPGTGCDDRPGGTVCNGTADEPACVECVTAADCSWLPPDDPCQTRTCVAHTCGQRFATSGAPLPEISQTAGDCTLLACDGEGGVAAVPEANDAHDDGNDCTADLCAGMTPENPSLALDTACGLGGALYCDGQGSCLGCTDAAQCGAPLTCRERTCVVGACGIENTIDPCDDDIACNGADSCDGAGHCSVHTGDPCLPWNDGDANCQGSCNEANGGTCDAEDPDGTGCSDPLWCNGTETCTGGVCSGSTGDPCLPLATLGDCSDACNEVLDDCTGNQHGTACVQNGNFCDGVETCFHGNCLSGAPPCPDSPTDCSDACNELADLCNAVDPSDCPASFVCAGDDCVAE